MKKYLSILFLIAFIIPSIAFASWWNPFSWKIFHKKEVVKIETPQINIDTEIKEKVDAQVKEVFKAKEDEQTRIDSAVKKALDKQTIQQKTQITTQLQPTPVVSKEKNYSFETKERIKIIISISESYKTWLEDTSDQFRSANLTLSGYSTTGLSGQIRDKSIEIANKEISVISSLIASNNKRILYFNNLLDSDTELFIDEKTFNSFPTIKEIESGINEAKQGIDETLSNVLSSLKYH